MILRRCPALEVLLQAESDGDEQSEGYDDEAQHWGGESSAEAGADLSPEDRAEGDEQDDGSVQLRGDGEDQCCGGVGCGDGGVLQRVDHLQVR